MGPLGDKVQQHDQRMTEVERDHNVGMYQVKLEDGTHMKNDGEGNEGMHQGKLKEKCTMGM